jgi:aldehyde reductase
MASPKVALNDGNQIPVLGFGSMRTNKEAISAAIDLGYRHIDTAYFYRNEKDVGDAINEAISDGKIKREDVFVTSKVFPTFFSKGRVIKSAKQSLETSGLEYLDLLLLHAPIVLQDDDNEIPKLPNGEVVLSDYDILDTYKELEEVKRLGLVKSIGVSNFNSVQIDRIVKEAQVIPVTNQVECHPYLNQEKLLNFCRERNITLTGYSPLGQRDMRPDDPSLFDDDTLKRIAAKYSKTVAQVLIKWQIQRGIICIPRSANKERIAENINIFDFTISNEDLSAINSLNRNYRYVKWSFNGVEAHKEYPFKIEF